MKNIKPKTLIFIIVICLLVEGCQHNEAVVGNPSATETALWKMTWDSVFATQTQMVSESTNEVSTLTPIHTLTATPSRNDEISPLQCETYLETMWGDRLGQWGGYSEGKGRFFLLLPLVFNTENEMYFSDFVNLRLLKYNGINEKPVQNIPLTSFFPEGYVYSWISPPYPPPVSLISISQDKIYVPYGGNRIGVLSLDGKIVNDIVIPNHAYNFNLPANDKLISVDNNGILYVQSSIQPIFFDNGWQSGNWVELLNTNGLIDPFYWRDYVVVMGGSVDPEFSSLISLYEISKAENDLEETKIAIKTGLHNGYLPSFGIDINGNVYFPVISENPAEQLYARYSLPTGENQVASLPYPYAGHYTNLEPSVSPDGILYLIAYNNEDLSVSPKIIKCNFPN